MRQGHTLGGTLKAGGGDLRADGEQLSRREWGEEEQRRGGGNSMCALRAASTELCGEGGSVAKEGTPEALPPWPGSGCTMSVLSLALALCPAWLGLPPVKWTPTVTRSHLPYLS